MSVETIRLPPDLGTLVDLAGLAHRLKARSCVLDWSDVKEVPPTETLAILFEEIELDSHADELGADTMTDSIADAVDHFFAIRPKRPAKQPPKQEAKPISTEDDDDDEPPPRSVRAGSEPPKSQRTKPVHDPVLQQLKPEEIRERLQAAIVADLLGPAQGPEEELSHFESSVRDRYLLGAIAPKYRWQDEREPSERPEMQDELGSDAETSDEDGAPEPTILATETMFPSSFGLTFSVAKEASQVRVRASWGHYEREPSAHARKADDTPHRVWKRHSEGGELVIDLADGAIAPRAPEKRVPEVIVQGIARTVGAQRVVSLFLVNELHEPEKGRDVAWIFQPELKVDAPDERPIFLTRAYSIDSDDGELQQLEMTYRNRVEFAVGHSASVHATVDPNDPTKALSVETRVVPVHEVPRLEAPDRSELPGLAGLVLDMKVLAEVETPADLKSKLLPMVDAYAFWIGAQRARVTAGAHGLAAHRSVAESVLAKCEQARQRIAAGIHVLTTDLKAFQAFKFANRAMGLQRVRSLFAEATRRGEKPSLEKFDIEKNRSWRTFQLGFLLLGIPSLADISHPDRTGDEGALVDLLWFATGGGKTEAYLGLAAFAMGIRRLQGEIAGHSGDAGITVLMRYTLRLLTLQQFQRASALICACESMRREAPAVWGKEPFRIGLWVGAKTTPNTTSDSNEAINKGHGLHSGLITRSTPAQLTNCPWCGKPIEAGQHIRVRTEIARTLTFCGDSKGDCLFSQRQSPDEGIPVLVVDEEIYRRLPSLLIATVDKFAQMPWNGNLRVLFGNVSARCPRHGFVTPEIEDSASHKAAGMLPAVKHESHLPLRPPDLIIQDELHLISGPLGTLTGLYETAVDSLCSWEVNGKRVRPKVIASTATIRRANDQVHALFQRRVEVFPPSGLDAEDNFFARERKTTDVAGRRYIGICAPGRRLKAALIRVYTAQLAAAQQLYERGAHADPWMTLVGYFNSLRELAGMRRLVEDDVRSRLRDMDKRGLAKRGRPNVRELTSRLGAVEIPRLLDLMELPFNGDETPPAKNEKGSKKRPPSPIDVLLATNMISVGVDVKRLGVMVTNGQPKTTSEYIQATSRVGRQAPGLVITVYNWARPRDLSHYESFEHYHSTFYKHVEPLSVTPFASRAIDRGLTGVLVSLIRLGAGGFSRNEDARAIERDSEVVARAVEIICERSERVTHEHAVGEQVRAALKSRLDSWIGQAKEPAITGKLGYRGKRDGVTRPLLLPAGDGDWRDFTCLNSLRDVEATASLILDDAESMSFDGRNIW